MAVLLAVESLFLEHPISVQTVLHTKHEVSFLGTEVPCACRTHLLQGGQKFSIITPSLLCGFPYSVEVPVPDVAHTQSYRIAPLECANNTMN